jgi:hypothetical protein
MSDDLFRDPFVLKVIRATLVSQGMRDERLEEAVEKVVRACVERTRRSGRPPTDVGQATALALTIVNAAAGRARARPDVASVPPSAPTSESKPPPAPMPAETPKPQQKAPPPPARRSPVSWIAAALAATLAALAAAYFGFLRPRDSEQQPSRAASESIAPIEKAATDSSAATVRDATAAALAIETGDGGEIDGQSAPPDAYAPPTGD